MTGCPTEHVEAAMLMQACRALEARLPELALLHAIPMAARHQAHAADLGRGREGRRPRLLPARRSRWCACSLYVELEAHAGRPGVARAARAWLSALEGQGYRACGWRAVAAFDEIQTTRRRR